eukprot:GHRR01015001.1.p1 GENE.GHRR01015001.1~~GHRR01015001.1.p1  ORF type:complete len:320 (+),score=42.09 GHRR01015001.1:513-1472(+)
MAGNCYPEGTADHVVTAVTAAAAGPIACSPEPILSLLNGFRRSKVLFAITSLNIPDLIAERGQPSLVTLARLLSASDDGLGRLLDAGVSLGLLDGNRTGYCLTQMAKTYLLKDSEYSLVGYISHSETFLYKLWGSLDTAVLTGHNCWHDVFGMDSSDVFASLYKEDASILRFMHGMHSFSKLSAHSVLTAFDLTPFKTLVDLGGATGALAVAACNLYPNMQAVVFDLPHVVNKAQKHFTAGAAVTAVKERLSWVTGDFFGQDQQFPAGDLYVLSRILHDWEEASCLKLLRLIHPRLPPGGCWVGLQRWFKLRMSICQGM